MADPKTPADLADADYAALADFRHALRRFQAFSEAQAAEQGLTPQQHQALLAIRGAAPGTPSVGDIAQRLMLKPHSATGLVNRLAAHGWTEQIGRASCRERVCPVRVDIGGGRRIKKKK